MISSRVAICWHATVDHWDGARVRFYVCNGEVHFNILVERAEQELILKREKCVHIKGAAYRTPTVYTIVNEKYSPYIVEMARHKVLISSM